MDEENDKTELSSRNRWFLRGYALGMWLLAVLGPVGKLTGTGLKADEPWPAHVLYSVIFVVGARIIWVSTRLSRCSPSASKMGWGQVLFWSSGLLLLGLCILWNVCALVRYGFGWHLTSSARAVMGARRCF